MSESKVIDVEAIQLTKSQSESEDLELECFNAAKKKVLDSFARMYLTQLLRKSRGDVVGAAKKAGKSRTGLWNLLKKYNIDPKRFCHRDI
jgi:DNA-binding NtrC family response regulator